MPIEQIYREEWGRIVATLIRLLGSSGVASFELAEEAAQEAFAVALVQWPQQGTPDNPRAWLIATARHKALDTLRRQVRWTDQGDPNPILEALAQPSTSETVEEGHPVEDDRLRLIFTCCHPALSIEAQVALTLRTLCGLTTEQIAEAFLVPLPTMGQRLFRARQKIRDAGIPYRTPPKPELAERLAAVLLVIYLVFNEGYNAAARGHDLCDEAIRLSRLVCELLPEEAEARGLLALMLLHHARRNARVSSSGDLILLEEQDRALWRQEEIQEGLSLTESALRAAVGPYTVQAAIAALHVQGARDVNGSGVTDWPQIVGLYDVLLRLSPSPVIELNRAAAVAMARGSDAGLTLLDELEQRGELDNYGPLHAARAALLWREQRWEPSAQAYRKALALASHEQERRFLAKRLTEAEANARQRG